VTLPLSELDSARFGVPIGRVVMPADEQLPADLPRRFLASQLDVLVVRYPAAEVGAFAAMVQPGVAVIHADTLLYYGWRVRGGPPTELPAGYTVASGPLEPSLLADTTAAIFDGYRNHYAANPLVAAEQVVAGYVDWAGRHLGTSDAAVLAIAHQGDLVAVAAVSFHGDELEIDLAGVVPAHRRRGIYDALLSLVEEEARRRSLAEVVISTQAHNLAPQRAWARRGWLPQGAFQTVHLVRAEQIAAPQGTVHP
jgi:ribosomal protein S18 acetylase RimI-like enzyme